MIAFCMQRQPCCEEDPEGRYVQDQTVELIPAPSSAMLPMLYGRMILSRLSGPIFFHRREMSHWMTTGIAPRMRPRGIQRYILWMPYTCPARDQVTALELRL